MPPSSVISHQSAATTPLTSQLKSTGMPRLKTTVTALLTLTVSIGVLSGTSTAQEKKDGEKKDEKTQSAPSFKADQLKFFEKDVRPILVARCFKCHGAEKKIKGGLRLTFRDGVLKGGDSGSLMVEDVTSNPRAVGLLFAGSNSLAVANPIDQVLSFLNGTMVGNYLSPREG